MEQKLNKLFLECTSELRSIGIDILNDKQYGKIEISIAKRNNKRYGCCKQEEPDCCHHEPRSFYDRPQYLHQRCWWCNAGIRLLRCDARCYTGARSSRFSARCYYRQEQLKDCDRHL